MTKSLDSTYWDDIQCRRIAAMPTVLRDAPRQAEVGAAGFGL